MSGTAPEELRLTVPEALDGERLDRALVALTEGRSRARLQELIRSGRVRVDGQLVRRPGRTVEAGARVRVESQPPRPPPTRGSWPAGRPWR